MDLDQLEGLLTQVIADPTSTEDCRRRFEAQLGTIENGGEEWLERRFMRLKKFFREAIMGILQEGRAGEDKYADRLFDLQHLINQVSKAEAFGLVQRSRAQIRKTVPELRQADHHKTVLRHYLEKDAPETTIDRIAKLIIDDRKDDILSEGETLTDTEQVQYYRAVCALNNRRAVYGRKLFLSARQAGKPELYAEALKHMNSAVVFQPEDMTMYSYLARKMDDKTAMARALKKLEPYTDFDDELIAYALTAKKLGDEQSMKKAAAKLGRNLKNPTYLTTYASLARAMGNIEHKKTAMEKLETRLDHPACLVTYASIARDENDTEKMQKAMALLAEHPFDIVCVTTFGAIARRLKDATATQRSLELLEPHLSNDIFCLTTYAKNAIAMNDQERKGRAMIELKNHLADPICETLYLQIAESGNQQSIQEAPAA